MKEFSDPPGLRCPKLEKKEPNLGVLRVAIQSAPPLKSIPSLFSKDHMIDEGAIFPKPHVAYL
jgi:hypothetical protein